MGEFQSLEVRRCRATLTVANSSHASGVQVGGLATFTDVFAPGSRPAVASSEIRGAVMNDPTDQAAVAFRLALFRADPTVGVTSSDNAALAMSDTVALLSCGYIDFLTTSCMSLGGSKLYVGTLANAIMPATPDDPDQDSNRSEDLNLYGLLQALGTWAPGATTGPIIDLYVARDSH